MIEKLKHSSKSTNFWNNASTIVSLGLLALLTNKIEDPESIKQLVLVLLGSTGVHNMGNILAHVNNPK